LLIIKDFKTMKIIEKDITLLVKNELSLLIQRYGGSTFDCLANVTSLFMSIEFESILKKLAFNCCDDKVQSSLPKTHTLTIKVKNTLESKQTIEVKAHQPPKLGDSIAGLTDS
jgi:hypothetical protein